MAPRRKLMYTVAGVVLLVLGVIWVAQRSLIYFPDSHLPSPAAAGVPRAEVVSFQTDDGLDLEAWFVPAGTGAADRTIVVFNGNGGNRADRGTLAARFAEHGWSTLLVDYRGYGGNPGLPHEAGLERDARAAQRYLTSRPDVDPTRIVYFGESLGAAVAIRLAVDHPPAALILRSPFSSLAAVGAHHYPVLPVRWLLRDRYPSINRIAAVRSPVLFIAGDADAIIPLTDTEHLFGAARDPKRLVIIDGADHNDETLFGGAEMMTAIRDFLNGSGGPPAS